LSGCGNFTDIYTQNELENIILKYIPCSAEQCVVTIFAQSDQCSSCKNSLSRRRRVLQDGSASHQSSSITFEIQSTIPLNEEVVTSNLNSNISNANSDLTTVNPDFKLDSNYTAVISKPSRKPTRKPNPKPTTKSSKETKKPKEPKEHKPKATKEPKAKAPKEPKGQKEPKESKTYDYEEPNEVEKLVEPNNLRADSSMSLNM
jgi:hypothetical protein